MFNSFFKFVQNNTKDLYNNSLILKCTDTLILISILAVFVFSMFAPSDSIGIFAVAAIGLTLVNLLFRLGDKLECSKFELFLLIYFMLMIISLCGSSLFHLSLKGFIKNIIYLGFYISVVQYLKNNKDKVWYVIFTIAGCVCIETIQGLLQTVVKPEAISTWQDTSYLNPEEIINRVYGTLKPYNPNLFGGYLVATIPALIGSIAFFVHNNFKNYAFCSSILALGTAYVLFQTGCRGAYLGLFAIILLIIALCAKFFWNTYKKQFISIASSIIALGTIFVMSVTSLRARVLSIFIMREDSSNAFRFNVYNSCLDMLKDNWLLGIGLGNQNFREIYGLYMKTGFDALSAYNIYLETAVESGIFALVAFVAFLAIAIYEAIKFIFNTQDKNELFAVATALSAIIGLMVHGFVDTVFFRPQIHFIFWTMIAIIRVYTYNERLNK
ncbi:MAG: O-antigen ligase family protein [Candidatus Gastranaerophilaceae bacterium]